MKNKKSEALKKKLDEKKHSHKYKDGKCSCGEVEEKED